MTVSIATQVIRCNLGTSDCNVTPEEYRSRVLIANSCKIATVRYGTTNQPGNPAVRPVTLSFAAPGSSVASAAPRTSSSTEGITPPSATARTIRLAFVLGGRYRE